MVEEVVELKKVLEYLVRVRMEVQEVVVMMGKEAELVLAILSLEL